MISKVAPRPNAPERPRRLTFKERQELDVLPGQIEALEDEQGRLYREMADPAIYQQRGDQVTQMAARLAAIEAELADAYARWEALDAVS